MMESEKPLLIILEGMDKSGKSTLKKLINKATNYNYIVVDRFTTSGKVYAFLYGEQKENNIYLNHLEEVTANNFDVLEVLCEAPLYLISARLKREARENRTGTVMPLDKIMEHKSLFNEYAKKSKYDTIFINTDASPSVCLAMVLNAIHDKVDKS